MKYTFIMWTTLLISCSGNDPGQIEGDKEGIPYIAPASLNLDTLLLHDFTEKITEQFYPNIHSVLIVKDGFLVYEEYFSGNDQAVLIKVSQT